MAVFFVPRPVKIYLNEPLWPSHTCLSTPQASAVQHNLLGRVDTTSDEVARVMDEVTTTRSSSNASWCVVEEFEVRFGKHSPVRVALAADELRSMRNVEELQRAIVASTSAQLRLDERFTASSFRLAVLDTDGSPTPLDLSDPIDQLPTRRLELTPSIVSAREKSGIGARTPVTLAAISGADREARTAQLARMKLQAQRTAAY